MQRLFVFGLGYVASRLAILLRDRGWEVQGTGRDGATGFEDDRAVRDALDGASHVLSSVPPDDAGDPVLRRYGEAIARGRARWVGYFSSTGVYGDAVGAWVDESSSVGEGRRTARVAADRAWGSLRGDVRIFRLPGIYGPDRSPLDRVREGRAHCIDLPGQVFSRVHVDDIVRGIVASFDASPGIYNLADDEPASQNAVIAYAARLLGLPMPPLQSLEEAGLSPAARAFYAENRRVANGKAKRLLGWRPLYPHYRAGLRALSATSSPAMAKAPPSAASQVQR